MQRWKQTPRFPAQRTSSAKLNRSPRTFKNFCELLRRINMKGQCPMKKTLLYQFTVWFLLPFLSSILAPSSFRFIIYHQFCSATFISCHFLFFFINFALPLLFTSTPRPCCDVCLMSLPPASRPCEREGVRRLRHSLGCFSTLVPWAEKAPPPLQPLSLRSPDPSSWYSGLCPCLPGTVSFISLTQFQPHPFCPVSPANTTFLFL